MAAKLPKLGSTLHLTLKRAHLLPLVYPVISRQTNSSSQPNTRMEIPSHRSRWYSFTTILFAAGVGATAYGLYGIYDMLTLWPPELRKDLRGGLAAKHKGDLELSEQYFRRAWSIAVSLPIEVFKVQPHLKTSGIAVCLAGVLESRGKLDAAYAVYQDALSRLQEAGTKEPLSGPEKLRAVAISYKLGEIAAALDKPEEEEHHLVWAVEALLKSVMPIDQSHGNISVLDHKNIQHSDSETQTMILELALPDWATKTDVAAPFEALGSFYAQYGKLEYAMPLYLQAISVLVPPPPQYSSAEDRCRGAQLMSNLSELIVRSQHRLTTKNLSQAESWATKALDIATHSKETEAVQNPTCEIAFAVALFNIAALRRMAGDTEKAKEFFLLSLNQSKAIGMEGGIVHAEEALRQLDEPATS